MADMGFLPEVTAILDQIPEGGQRLLFSATLDQGVDTLVERYLVDPVTHSTDDAQASVTTMSHHVLLIDPQDKKALTAEVANRGGRIIVFVRTKLGADRIAEQLREQGVLAAALHGGLSPGACATACSAPSATARCRCSSPPTSPLAASTSTTSSVVAAGRPAGRPQGLPAPLGPHGPRRRERHRRHARPAAPAPKMETPASSRRRRRRGTGQGRPGRRGDRRHRGRTPSGVPVADAV